MPVLMFSDRFVSLIEREAKHQTIRGHAPKPGDTISLRTWSGKAYRSKQRTLREVTVLSVSPVVVDLTWLGTLEIELDGTMLSVAETEAFAREDGFRDGLDMATYYAEHRATPFHGFVIRFD